ATTPTQVIQSRSALLRRDGRVVAINGSPLVGFYVPVGNYHVAIRHRNHLGCMTNSPVAVSASTPLLDLSVSSTPTWGTGARANVNGTMVLWPGDVNFDHQVMYTGTSNDRDPVLEEIGGVVPTAVVNGIYNGTDTDLNGNTKYTGSLNDRDIILQTIGGVVPTAVRQEQIP
ncbi:MAG: hemagglutinin protein, partial [Flavobacteriales bacterium]|nr:hemagglutinin protein [Flavobacteriales bacterium]